MLRMFVLVVALTACGSNKPLFGPPDKLPAAGSGSGSNVDEAAAAQHEEKATMPPAVAKFRDLLAAHWQAPQGPQRMQDTCAALPDFLADADAIAKATPPTTANADTWTTATKALVEAVADLDTTCKANDTAQFEAVFGKVHDSFHALVAAGGGGKM